MAIAELLSANLKSVFEDPISLSENEFSYKIQNAERISSVDLNVDQVSEAIWTLGEMYDGRLFFTGDWP